jgi:hypothetical protein
VGFSSAAGDGTGLATFEGDSAGKTSGPTAKSIADILLPRGYQSKIVCGASPPFRGDVQALLREWRYSSQRRSPLVKHVGLSFNSLKERNTIPERISDYSQSLWTYLCRKLP